MKLKNKKRINFVLWRSDFGGLEKVLKSYIKQLRDPFECMNLFSLRPTFGKDSYFNNDPVNYYTGSNSNLLLCFVYVSYVYKRKNEIFHLMNVGPFILLLTRFTGCKKIVYHIHGTIYWNSDLQRKIKKFIWRLALSKHLKIIANSGYSKLCFNNSVNQNFPVQVIYNPVYSTDQRLMKYTKQQGLSICYSGRLSAIKNLHKWLEVAMNIHNFYPDCHFYIYGNGPIEDSLKNYCIEHNINEFVHFMGFVENIENEYAKHDLLLFLSKRESFGNVVIESILAETPVIVSDIPAMREIFADFPDFLVPLNEKIHVFILNKLANLEPMKLQALQAKRKFKKKYSLNNYLKNIECVYENIL